MNRIFMKELFRRRWIQLSNINRCKLNIIPVGTATFQVRMHGDYPKVEDIQIKWILKDGKEKITPAATTASLLDVAHHHDIDLEGACGGVCACSTCHIILTKDVYDALPEASEKEEDMLDQAFGLTATSRLGCQVNLTAEHNNISVKLPKATRNFYVVSELDFSHSVRLELTFGLGWTCSEAALNTPEPACK